MAERLRAPAALLEVLSSIPSKRGSQSIMGSGVFFWHVGIYADRTLYIINKSKKKKMKQEPIISMIHSLSFKIF